MSAAKSANALLAVYIGGAGGFFGPILGTIVVVLLQSGVSLLSNAWLLYVGVLFIVMVMYAPVGLDRADRHARADLARGQAARAGAALRCAHLPPALMVLLGFVLLVELASLHHHRRGAGQDASRSPATAIDTTSPLPWVIALAALGLGGAVAAPRGARVPRCGGTR